VTGDGPGGGGPAGGGLADDGLVGGGRADGGLVGGGRADGGREDDGYAGPAVLRVGQARFDVQVNLRGFFQPIDGRYHWYGRIASNARLSEALGGGRADGSLETGHAVSPCELSEPDLWGRYRVAGWSAPPFPVAARALRTPGRPGSAA